jgi:uncharacterized protein
MNLLPREEKFFAYFERQAAFIVEAATELNRAVRAGQPGLQAAAEKIAELERRADEVIHEAFIRLNSTFITPLDPEDIHTLASHLDNVIDGIEEAAHRLVAYEIQTVPEPVKELCAIIVECTITLQRACHALSKGQPLLEHCIRINELEGRADKIGRKAVAELFKTEKDPIELIKLKEVYEILEKTTDYAEDVGNVLEEVTVKNS